MHRPTDHKNGPTSVPPPDPLAQALSPWVSMARQKDKTLILLHHARKGGGQHGEGIAGGHALLGVVDSALELNHDNAAVGRRLLRAPARLISPSALLDERRADGTMHVLGAPAAVRKNEVRQRVLQVFEPGPWLTTADVREKREDPKPAAEQVGKALLEAAKAGELERDPPVEEDAERKKVRWRRIL